MTEDYSALLEQTRKHFSQVQCIFQTDETLSAELWENLEKALLSADVGPQTSQWIKEKLQQLADTGQIQSSEQAYLALRQQFIHLLEKLSKLRPSTSPSLAVMMVMGDNGPEVTSSATKLTYYLSDNGQKALLISKDLATAADKGILKASMKQGDVFVRWLDHDTDLVRVIDTLLQPGYLRSFDVVIIDVPAHLTTDNKGLEELHNAIQTIHKLLPDVPLELFGVFDATYGQRGLSQFRYMSTYTGLTGVIFAKVELSTKGGCIIAITDDLGIPITFLATGKETGYLIPFDPANFVAALFE
jgi:fused signal recognition particle receptor